MTRVDDLVLREIARLQIEQNNGLVTFDQLCSDQALADVPQQDLVDSLEILGQKYLIKISYVMGAPLSHVVLTDFGFQEFAEAYVDDYQGTLARVAALMVNENVLQNDELAEHVGQPIAFVDFVLNLLESSGHIKKSNYLGGLSRVWQIAPSLKRALAS